MARRPKLSAAFWLVLFLIFAGMDLFVTPAWMNHYHGIWRWMGLLIGGFTILPTVMVIVHTYQYINHLIFMRSINRD
jgi:hypothetical protein